MVLLLLLLGFGDGLLLRQRALLLCRIPCGLFHHVVTHVDVL